MKFKNALSLIVVIIIAAEWFFQGYGYIKLPDNVIGALIVTWTLIIQHYVRKAKPE